MRIRISSEIESGKECRVVFSGVGSAGRWSRHGGEAPRRDQARRARASV